MEKVLLYIIAASALCVLSSLSVRQYHFIYQPKNWTQAQTYCRERFTDLVTVDSLDVVTILNAMADVSKMGSTKDAWIGLSFDVISWKWSLSDGLYYSNNQAYFRNWASGEPNSVWYTGDCAQMYDSGQWNDAPCEWLYNPICSSVSGQNVNFVFINQLMTWPNAQNYCRQHYTDMASARNASENEKIRTTKPAGPTVWIGLYKDTWKWSNGPMYIFRYWASGQPSGGMEKCAASNFGSSGLWGDWTCDVEKAFICYDDPVPFTKQVMKVELVKDAAMDLKDPAVQDDLLKELKQKLTEQKVSGNIKLSWRKQLNGEIFMDQKDQNN